jgi:hypothetical protein
MKNICFLVCLLSASLWAQVGFELPLENIRGVSLGYSYQPIFLFGTKTGTTMYPTHKLFFNLDGIINSIDNSSSYSYGNDPGFFGGLGVVAGFSASEAVGGLESRDRYYSGYYRMTALDQKVGDMMLIGGNVRAMGLLPFSSEVSIVDSYFDIMLEAGYMGLNYKAEAGGFNNYVSKEVSEGGFYFSANLGIKVFLVEVYGGIGGLFGLYKKGIELEVKDREIANPPDKTNHFLALVGAGVVIDLHSMADM